MKRGERICGHRVGIMAQRPTPGSCESIAGLRFRDYNANQPHFPRQGRFRCAARGDRPVPARSPWRWRSARGPSPESPLRTTRAKDVKKPSLSLKASPTIVFSPARVVVSAELKGGAEDNAELYCPSLEWDWGDGTRSESNADCEPFEAGKSTIQRRFTRVAHVQHRRELSRAIASQARLEDRARGPCERAGEARLARSHRELLTP